MMSTETEERTLGTVQELCELFQQKQNTEYLEEGIHEQSTELECDDKSYKSVDSHSQNNGHIANNRSKDHADNHRSKDIENEISNDISNGVSNNSSNDLDSDLSPSGIDNLAYEIDDDLGKNEDSDKSCKQKGVRNVENEKVEVVSSHRTSKDKATKAMQFSVLIR